VPRQRFWPAGRTERRGASGSACGVKMRPLDSPQRGGHRRTRRNRDHDRGRIGCRLVVFDARDPPRRVDRKGPSGDDARPGEANSRTPATRQSPRGAGIRHSLCRIPMGVCELECRVQWPRRAAASRPDRDVAQEPADARARRCRFDHEGPRSAVRKSRFVCRSRPVAARPRQLDRPARARKQHDRVLAQESERQRLRAACAADGRRGNRPAGVGHRRNIAVLLRLADVALVVTPGSV
jgi:hypothetical protein